MDHPPIDMSPGWWFGTWILFFHISGIIIPTDFHIFQRGGTTNQSRNEWFHPLTDALRSPAIGQLWAALLHLPGWRQESGALKWKSLEIRGPLRHLNLEMSTYVDLFKPIQDQFFLNCREFPTFTLWVIDGNRDVLRRQWLQKVHISFERLKQS